MVDRGFSMGTKIDSCSLSKNSLCMHMCVGQYPGIPPSIILMPLLLPPASSPTPSPAVLDFLAQLSPHLPPNSPPAPVFLCPSCERPELSSARRRRRQLPTPSFPNPSLTPPEQQQSQSQQPSQHSPQHSHHPHRSKTSYNQYDSSLIASVPPRFVQSPDGFWYIATSWAFHGQTSQPNLLSTPISTSSPPPPSSTLPFSPSNVVSTIQPTHPNNSDSGDDDDDGDDDAADFTAPIGYTTSAESVVASDYDAIKDSLPTGWTRPPERTKFYSTPVIIVVSLILAISLSLIIAACVLGHKAKSGSQRQSFRKILNEAKSRANAQRSLSRASSPSRNLVVDAESGDPELEIISDSERAEKILKNLKRREKLWDKWRSKGSKLSDFGLRRRKKKATVLNNFTTSTTSVLITQSVPAAEPATPVRIVHVSPTTPPPSTLNLPAAITSTPSGQSPSLSISPGSPAPNISILSLQATSTSTAEDDDNLSTLPTRTNSRRHPPAYRHNAAVVAESDQKGALSSEIGRSESLDSVDIELDEDPETHPETHPEYSPLLLPPTVDLPPHRAHVATDDKAVLEMMRRGASEPQPPSDAHVLSSAGIMIPEPSKSVRPNAPVWVDESLEHFESLKDSSDRDSHVKSSPSGSKLQLPPLPPPDLHRRLERHYNVDVLLPSTQSSTQANLVPRSPSLHGSEPPLPDSGLNLSPSLRPSAPPEDDDEWDSSILSNHLRPSAPPLLSDSEKACDDDDSALYNEEAVHSDERRSRWDREADLEASLARTRSTPGTAASIMVSLSSSRPQRRRSLSVSSLENGSSNPAKRLSLPRYEP